MEQLDYNLLYRWFVGLTPDEAVWVPTVFTKNRDRLLEGNIAEAFFQQVLALADEHHVLSHEHFTVDGSLLEAWASHKNFRPLDQPPAPSDDDPSNPEFIAGVRTLGFTPHVSPNLHRFRRRSLVDGRTTRHAGYAISQ